MAVFKCKMCGGDLEVTPGDSVGECQYCGAKQTLPHLDDEKRAGLYERANRFRRAGDFDKASALYETLLDEDGNDAEAYWSLVLCKYGVGYVEDPQTHQRVPTCNRTQYTSIFADPDYQGAITHADGYQKEIYQAEAKAIDEIQQGILALSGQEEPFDVFICYKESDAAGRRTPDSVLAQELYQELSEAGFRVFFARTTLEGKLGSAYEPYIFAALQSASVMVVVGTRPEYFQAVWVKNEWSRFLALMRGGAKKALIPAYRDMDPYDLPEEFSHLQAQDMGKLGFIQDLIHAVQKISAVPGQEETGGTGTQAGIASLLGRMKIFLEDQDWDAAAEYAERILDIEPENVRAYVGAVMAACHLSYEWQLAETKTDLAESPYFLRALRFADPEYRETLQGYQRQSVQNETLANKEALYQEALTIKNTANSSAFRSEKQYRQAADIFAQLGDYRDAKEQLRSCNQLADEAAKVTLQIYKAQREREVKKRLQQERQRLANEQARQSQTGEKQDRRFPQRIVAGIILAAALVATIYLMIIR